jgi:hypothetical protein
MDRTEAGATFDLQTTKAKDAASPLGSDLRRTRAARRRQNEILGTHLHVGNSAAPEFSGMNNRTILVVMAKPWIAQRGAFTLRNFDFARRLR